MTHKRGIERGHNIPPETPEDLFCIARAFQYSRALHLANNMEVFTRLAGGPMTAEGLSERMGVELPALEKVLIAAAMGLLVTDGERFSNSLVAARYLVRGKPEYVGDAIWLTGGWWDRMNELSAAVLPPPPAEGAPPEEVWHERFIRAMHDYASTGDAELLADAVDLSGRRKLLDLGGGPGTYAVYFCKKYPELAAVVFDLPESEPVFREVVESYGMAGRVKFKPGDLDKTPLGKGYDVALVSNMMHGYRGDVIPPKVFRALVPGGLILVRDFILYPEKNGPLAAALFNMGIGAYSEEEMLEFLSRAGFVDAVCRELANHTLIAACKPAG